MKLRFWENQICKNTIELNFVFFFSKQGLKRKNVILRFWLIFTRTTSSYWLSYSRIESLISQVSTWQINFEIWFYRKRSAVWKYFVPQFWFISSCRTTNLVDYIMVIGTPCIRRFLKLVEWLGQGCIIEKFVNFEKVLKLLIDPSSSCSSQFLKQRKVLSERGTSLTVLVVRYVWP